MLSDDYGAIKIKTMKLLISGCDGLLARNIMSSRDFRFRFYGFNRKEMDVTSIKQLEKRIDLVRPDAFLHCAAMTHPMEEHEIDIERSIETNIIGTSNVAMICRKYNIKMIHVSTDWVYGEGGNKSEDDPINPISNYSLSKVGGECAARMDKSNLILRCCFTERPFKHERAFIDAKKSCLYVDEIVPIILELIYKKCKGVYNVGGKAQSTYEFAQVSNPHIKAITRKELCEWYPADTTMDLSKMKEVLSAK